MIHTRCFVDYLLHSSNWHPTQGLQQAMDYAKKLGVRFVYATNGEQIYEFDLASGKGEYVESYPTPDELLTRSMGETTDLGRELRNLSLFF